MDSAWFTTVDQQGNWTKSLQDLPEVTLEVIKHYLITSKKKTFDKDAVKAYKCLKAYKFFDEGYVQRIQLTKTNYRSEAVTVCKAEIMASMSRKIYRTLVCISEAGDILGATCTCVAGKGSACNHAAGLLFALQDFISEGLKTVPPDTACTDKLKKWNKPALRQVEYTTADNIQINRAALGKRQRDVKDHSDLCFDKHHSVDQEALKCLHTAMKDILPKSGFAKYGIPASTSYNSNLPSCDYTLSYISIHPPSLHELCDARNKFMESLKENTSEIEEETRGQSTNSKWHEERAKRLTASNFHAVFSRRQTTDPTRLVKQLLAYSVCKSTKAMRFGLAMENKAADRYLRYLANENYTLKCTGLRIMGEHPYLAASADRILINQNGREIKIVELKNPSSTWDMTIKEAALKLSCLKFQENEVVLNTNDKYHTQIQGQMAVYGIHECDFVLCTRKDIFVQNVPFNEQLWDTIEKKLSDFYFRFLAPEIIYPSVKYGYPLLSLP